MFLEKVVWFCMLGQAFSQNEYSYGDQDFWSDDYPRCGGRSQSPIKINTQNTIPVFTAPFIFYGYTRPLPIPLSLRNERHTVDLSVIDDYEFFAPVIRGGALPGVYQFKGLHFHWGSNDRKGAEHFVDDKPYSLEMHLVHKNIKYPSLDHASNFTDGWLVLTVLFQLSASDNSNLAPIVENLHIVQHSSNATYLYHPITLKDLLDNINTGKYYTYHGSQTTPPCSEVVTWIIFTQPSKISHRQLEKFRRLIGYDGKRILNNRRHMQATHARPVFLRLGSKRRYFGGKKIQPYNKNSV